VQALGAWGLFYMSSDPSQNTYVALARRYRPQHFSEIIGQTGITRTLQHVIDSGRVHHAYLFSGPRGIGKTTAARVLARGLTKPQHAHNSHSSDIIEIDGASHTGVDDIRALRDGTHYLPLESAYKVYIIDEVHMLSTSAFNALLKTLEEPPSHVVFILATTEIQKIPATVRSRCQQYDFRRVAHTELLTYLEEICVKEDISLDLECLEIVAKLSDGCVRDSLSLLDQLIATGISSPTEVAEFFGVASQTQLNNLTRAILENNPVEILNTTRRWQEKGILPITTALKLTQHLYHLYLYARAAVKDNALTQKPLSNTLESILPKTFDTELFDIDAIKTDSPENVSSKLGFLFMALNNIVTHIESSSLPHESLTVHLLDLAENGAHYIRIDEIAEKLKHTIPAGRETRPVPAPSPPTPQSIEVNNTTSTRPDPDPQPVPSEPEHLGSMPVDQRSNAGQQNTFAEFQQVLTSIDSAAASAYLSGYLIDWMEDKIQIGFPEGSFDLDRASNAERKKAVTEKISEKLGRNINITVVALSEDKLNANRALNKKSIVEVEEEERDRQRNEQRDSILSHDLTVKIQSQLGGTLESIRRDT